MSWLEKKYVNLLSPRLERFVWKSPNLSNFRCPRCGDSSSNVKKTRGYIYERSNKWQFHCHNCGESMSFPMLLKSMDYRLYNEYKLEQMADKPAPVMDHINKTNVAVFFNRHHSDDMVKLKTLPKISQLPHDHPAKKYITSRKIPNPYHSILRWSDNFQAWVNELIPKKFSDDALKYDEGRIVIPFIDRDGVFYGLQGRALSANSVRYIMVIIDPSIPVVYGSNNIDPKKDIWAFEGPFDSMFIENAVAFGGSHFSALTNIADRDRFIVAVDNEPHSLDAKKKLTHIIDHGFRVVIWPSFVQEKDVNEMVLAGMSPAFITDVMKSHTYQGLMAKAKAAEWFKC